MTESTYTTTFSRAELDTSLWVVAWDGNRSPAWSRTGSGPRRTNDSASSASGSSTSAPAAMAAAGPARAITAASMVKAREVGLDEAMLGVDSENPNGALGLYEGLGFKVESRAAAYRRDLKG